MMPWYVFRSLSSFHVPTSALHSPICGTVQCSGYSSEVQSVYRDIQGGGAQLHVSPSALHLSICMQGMEQQAIYKGEGTMMTRGGARSRKGAATMEGDRNEGVCPIQGRLHGSQQMGGHSRRKEALFMRTEWGAGVRPAVQCSARPMHGQLCRAQGAFIARKKIEAFLHSPSSSLTGLTTCSLMSAPALW